MSGPFASRQVEFSHDPLEAVGDHENADGGGLKGVVESSRCREQRPDFAVPVPCRAGSAKGPNRLKSLPEPFREKTECGENKGIFDGLALQAVSSRSFARLGE